jgi:uncharacterized protein (TIGR02271 family)
VKHEKGDERFAPLEKRFAGYEVYDAAGERVGKVDEIFVDEHGRPEYVGVKMSQSGTESALIPLDAAQVDEGRRAIEVPMPKSRIEDGPSYGYDQEITSEFEQQVYSYYGLKGRRDAKGHDSTADHRAERYESSSRPVERDAGEPANNLSGTDEPGIRRSEEEARVETREREAGRVNVRKQVRTEREQVRVPKMREQVDIERVPGEGREAPGAKIGEDEEVVIQVFEEEVVVSKRIVLKEEIRLRKKVVEEEEVVEVDLRKEEVEIEDTTGRGVSRDTGEHEDSENKL